MASRERSRLPGAEVLIVALIVLLDQLSKHWAQLHLPPLQRTDFLPGFLSFFLTWNTGAGFSILDGQRWLLTAVSAAALLAMILFHRSLTFGNTWARLAWAMIFAGALGNLIDRFLNGSVVDFLAFDFVRFPVFNVADMAITGGATLFIFLLVYDEIRQRQRSGGDGNGS